MKIKNKEEIKVFLPKRYIKRDISADLEESLEKEEITVIYGPRQVGKSVELWKLVDKLVSNKKNDVFYFNFDILPKDTNDPDKFLAGITAQLTGTKAYVFIDEAQRLNNISLWIKYLYDQKKNIKWILTGSASLDLKNKIKESLIGRKIEYYIGPLKTGEIVTDRGFEVSKIKNNFAELDKIIDSYLKYGGYPGVVTLIDEEEKKKKLTEIAETYVIADIADLYGIKDRYSLRLVVSFLAENIGGILSKDNLSTATGVSKNEVEKCLEALEGSFLLRLLRTFSKDKTRELTHRPKVYFEDLGIRNAILGKLEEERLTTDRGKLFENLIVKLAGEKWGWKNVRYWRTINQTEIDIVVVKPLGRIEAIEAKYKAPGKMPKNLKSFEDKYEKVLDRTQVISKENWWKIL